MSSTEATRMFYNYMCSVSETDSLSGYTSEHALEILPRIFPTPEQASVKFLVRPPSILFYIPAISSKLDSLVWCQ
jgi:hypothetical protein